MSESEFFRWLTVTHTQHWHAHDHTSGTGLLYQGRFKSFPVETDEYLYEVLWNVERNSVRGELLSRSEAWRWSSDWRFCQGTANSLCCLFPGPISRPRDWLTRLNRTTAELPNSSGLRSNRRYATCSDSCD